MSHAVSTLTNVLDRERPERLEALASMLMFDRRLVLARHHRPESPEALTVSVRLTAATAWKAPRRWTRCGRCAPHSLALVAVLASRAFVQRLAPFSPTHRRPALPRVAARAPLPARRLVGQPSRVGLKGAARSTRPRRRKHCRPTEGRPKRATSRGRSSGRGLSGGVLGSSTSSGWRWRCNNSGTLAVERTGAFRRYRRVKHETRSAGAGQRSPAVERRDDSEGLNAASTRTRACKPAPVRDDRAGPFHQSPNRPP